MPEQARYIVVAPQQWWDLLVGAFEAGMLPWDRVFMDLYNSGWRGRVDRHGFPTQRERANA
jgi:hypothetical protein